MSTKSIWKPGLVFAVVAAVIATITTLIHYSTRDAIADQQRAAQASVLLEIIPPSRHDNSLLDDTVPVADQVYLHLPGPDKIYIARQHGIPVAVIVPAVAPDGYGGPIKLIVGINADGTVAGVRVLAHRETPGLGDKIDTQKSGWILGFDQRSLSNPQPSQWQVKRDHGVFDQFTGATITPRAITRAVYQALLYFQENRSWLLAQPVPEIPNKQDES